MTIDDDDDAPLTPEEEEELTELDEMDYDKESEKFSRTVQFMIHAKIREFKRGGMSHETFYKFATGIEATTVLHGLVTSEEAMTKVNEYMRIFEEEKA